MAGFDRTVVATAPRSASGGESGAISSQTNKKRMGAGIPAPILL
jgi:hypothetical protein